MGWIHRPDKAKYRNPLILNVEQPFIKGFKARRVLNIRKVKDRLGMACFNQGAGLRRAFME